MQRLFVALSAFILAACQSAVPVSAPAFSKEQIEIFQQNGFEQVGDSWQLGINDKLLFPTDESELRQEQALIIERLTRALLGVGVRGARVVGHTDSTGSESYNDTLSEKRALSVKDAMAKAGMAPEAIEARGLGARQPVESNDTEEGRQENRRVVVIVTSLDVS